MKSHLKYASYLLRHKWFVFWAALALDVPFWRALLHDWTKFTPAEWGPYVRRFYAGRGSQMDKSADPSEFHMAWRHHWTRNPHHWEYWLPEPIALKQEDAQPLQMPETYVREMVADWVGAGMAQHKPDIYGWYTANAHRMLLHDETRRLVKHLLSEAQRKQLFPMSPPVDPA